MSPRTLRAPWEADADERLDVETARVGARVIHGTFQRDTARNIALALKERSLAPDVGAADANEAFLLAFYLSGELIKGGWSELDEGTGIDPVASDDRPVGPDPEPTDGVRADADADGVGAVGEGGGSVRELRTLDGGNPWVRAWRLTWGLS